MRRAHGIRNFVVVMVLTLFYVPLVFILSKSFFYENDFSLYWFQELFQDPSFWSALKLSSLIALISSALSVALALLVVLKMKPNKFLDRLMLVSLSFPEIVLALSSLSLFVLINWPLGLVTVIVGHTTLTLSFAFFILSAQMKKMDVTLLEAARDLGANSALIRKQILLPFLKNSILSSFLLCFLMSLDDFLISFFLSGVGQDTLPIKLFSMLKIGISPKMNALSFLIFGFSFLIMIIFFPLFKKIQRKQNG